jgi:hypothetical protein
MRMTDKNKDEKPTKTPKPEKEITIERIKEIGREVGRKHLPRPKRP